jgi:hypothetical protein
MPGDQADDGTSRDGAMTLLTAPAKAKAPEERFTGDVWVDGITGGAGPGTATLAAVRFSPGARTAWHRHENGQTLHVTEGVGIVQSRDGQTILMLLGTPPGPRLVSGTGTARFHIRSCRTSRSQSPAARSSGANTSAARSTRAPRPKATGHDRRRHAAGAG